MMFFPLKASSFSIVARFEYGTLTGPEDISFIARIADKGFVIETEAQSETEPNMAAEKELDEYAAESETALEPKGAVKTETAQEAEEATADKAAAPEPDESVKAETAQEPVGTTAKAEMEDEPFGTVAETEIAQELTEAAAEAETAPYDAPDRLAIEYPLTDITDEVLANLRKMVAAKAPLLKRALGAEDLPILLTPNCLKFPWFTGPLDADTVRAYAQFITCLVETAKRKKRVTAQPIETDNFRFSMRVWSISLGMVGSEYSKIRRLLYQNLDGDSGWRYGSPKKAEKHINITNSSDILPDGTRSEDSL